MAVSKKDNFTYLKDYTFLDNHGHTTEIENEDMITLFKNNFQFQTTVICKRIGIEITKTIQNKEYIFFYDIDNKDIILPKQYLQQIK